jgi:hypothetical protein
MSAKNAFARRFRRPFRVRWSDLGPPRLESAGATSMPKAFHQYGSLVDRVTRIFFAMDPDTVEKVLQTYRLRYGDGAYAYAKRTIASWQHGQVRHVGQTVMRLLEVVPMFVDLDTKFELVRIMREETLRRLRQSHISLYLQPDQDLGELMQQLRDIVQAQVAIELPPGYLEMQAWLSAGDAIVFQRMIRATERELLLEKSEDFLKRVRYLQYIRREIQIPVTMKAVFELPTARITLRIVNRKKATMTNEEYPQDDHGLLARWNDLELETRFKSGEVSYPEYVLRNMDQFFTKEEQSELHKIAAMHGLELERTLMEIQIKSRTSEADLQKLLTTLKTLQDKGIAADILSRHETPSGHIEISARSRKRFFGCMPWFVMLAGLGIAAVILLS